jgi:hypothetical protein
MAGRPRRLNEEAIAEIRAWHAARSSLATPKEMQRRHGICATNLRNICSGIIYKVRRHG